MGKGELVIGLFIYKIILPRCLKKLTENF